MNLKDIISVFSVQHTGTWFAINFLKNFIPRSKELTFVLEADDMKPLDANVLHRSCYSQPLEEPTIVHVHLPIVRYLNFEVNFCSTWFEQTWLMSQGKMRSLPVDTLLMLCNFFKVVIPLRDPFAAILSREARQPQFRHFVIVDGFIALATEFARHPNVKFLPIDLYEGDADQRRKLLTDVLHHCSIDIDTNQAVIDRVANEWKVENPTPGNRFKQAYSDKDTDQLMQMLGPKWAEVEYLKNMASILHPFMTNLGYKRGDLGPW